MKAVKVKAGTVLADAAKKAGVKDCFCAKIEGKLSDLDAKLAKDSEVAFLTFDDEEGRDVFGHSTAHVLAHAIRRLYPKAKNTIGPPVEEGFYYDFAELDISSGDFPKIEAEMKKIIAEGKGFELKELTLADAKKLFKDNKFKIELAEEFQQQEQKLTAYKEGDFIDLCKGPHVPSVKMIGAVKLLKIAGAYWRGDPNKEQLTRIYGISFPSEKQLQDHLKLLQEAEKRDHRKIGQRLELFMFHEYSPGSPFLLPKGTVIYNELLKFLREEYRKRGYQEVITPLIYNKALWEQSGHWEHFRENMFLLKMDDQEASLKPMNCPSHLLIFKNKARSYRELPLRIADFAQLHRNELRGVVGGMTRVRKMSQDDAHIFCAPEQIEQEMLEVLKFVTYVYDDVFRLAYTVKLSTKPEKAMGEAALWSKAEAALEAALRKAGVKYEVKKGEGAFYGPKIDFDVTDAIGRRWQCATIQLDFQMPLRFKAEYEGADNKKHICVMIHRAILGTLERFIGVMTEHYAGKFPLWLSPEQARLLPITERQNDYARKAAAKMFDAGIRVNVDASNETAGKKIREAQLSYVNYILVVGEKEEKAGTVNVRTLDRKVHGEMKIEQFVKKCVEEVAKRS